MHDDQQSVTLRFEAQDTCTFVNESIVEYHEGTESRELVENTTRKMPASSCLGTTGSASTETATTKVATNPKEYAGN